MQTLLVASAIFSQYTAIDLMNVTILCKAVMGRNSVANPGISKNDSTFVVGKKQTHASPVTITKKKIAKKPETKPLS